MHLPHLRLTALLAFAAFAAQAEERLPTIPSAQYTAEQKQAAADFEAARKVPVFGPFEPLMHSPQVMSQARAMGDYLRYKSAIGNTLSELAILVTAREWTQDYEWFVHYPIALKAGIRQEITDAIAEGRRPTAMSPDEEIVYEYSMDVRTRQVALRHQGCGRPDRNRGLLHLSWHAAQRGAVPASQGCQETSEVAPLVAGTGLSEATGLAVLEWVLAQL
jgi:4-carboxymuconolactone decarboxylase